MNKKAANFEFFLSHLYDDVGDIYNIDGDSTRSLVKYLKKLQKWDDKAVLNHLKRHKDYSGVEQLLAEIAAKETGGMVDEKMTDDNFHWAIPVGQALGKHINDLDINKEANMKVAGPAFTIPVSENEKEVARKVRKSFEKVIKQQDKFMSYLSVLFDHLEELDNQTGLTKISPLIKKYEYKMKKKFNAYIKEFSKALNVYENSFSDTEMDDIRDLIIENIRSMREIVIDLVVLMKDVGSDTFIQESLEKYRLLEELSEKLEDVIRTEWFGHIDFDILGKIRLGSNSVPLSIK